MNEWMTRIQKKKKKKTHIANRMQSVLSWKSKSSTYIALVSAHALQLWIYRMKWSNRKQVCPNIYMSFCVVFLYEIFFFLFFVFFLLALCCYENTWAIEIVMWLMESINQFEMLLLLLLLQLKLLLRLLLKMHSKWSERKFIRHTISNRSILCWYPHCWYTHRMKSIIILQIFARLPPEIQWHV